MRRASPKAISVYAPSSGAALNQYYYYYTSLLGRYAGRAAPAGSRASAIVFPPFPVRAVRSFLFVITIDLF